jgi:hypothetical protein
METMKERRFASEVVSGEKWMTNGDRIEILRRNGKRVERGPLDSVRLLGCKKELEKAEWWRCSDMVTDTTQRLQTSGGDSSTRSKLKWIPEKHEIETEIEIEKERPPDFRKWGIRK